MFICSEPTAVFVYGSTGPTAVYDIAYLLGIEQTLASGKAGMGSTPSRRVKMYWCISFIVSISIAACPIVLPYIYVGSVSQDVHMAPCCLCSNDVYAVTQKSCSGQEYWTSGDLELSSALSTLVIVSLHGATPMRGVGVCDNGESLLFNTSCLSPSLSLSLFVQVGGSLKGTGCGVFNYSSSEPSFFFTSFSYFSLTYPWSVLYLIHDHIWHFREEHTWGATVLPEGRLLHRLF